MSPSVNPIPDGYPRVIPSLVIDGAAQAIDFYREALGATERMRMDGPDGKVGHAELEIGESVIFVADEFPDMGYVGPKKIGGSPVTLMVYVEDVDATFDCATKAGANVTLSRRGPVLRRPRRPVRRSVRPPLERRDPRRGRSARRDGQARRRSDGWMTLDCR